MYTTIIDSSSGPENLVILRKDGREVARMTLDEFIRLSAVQYVMSEASTAGASSRE